MSLLGPVVEWCDTNPLDYIEWLPGQQAFLEDPSRSKLFRAGNQAQGKSTAGCAETYWNLRGEHPFHPVVHRPLTMWVSSSSEQQSGILQEKLWRIVPRRFVHPDSEFDASKGAFRGKYPKLGVRSVWGGWSWLHFRWTGQHTLNLASGTVDGWWYDEPPFSRRAFTELERRLTKTGGPMYGTLTPVNAPVDYIRELCQKGAITDHHFALTPQNLIPVGRDRPLCTGTGRPMDAAWIQEQRALVSSWEAPVVLDGEWEFRLQGHVFERFDPDKMVTPRIPGGNLKYALGLDHGEGLGREAAVFVVVDDSRPDRPLVYVLDEYSSTIDTTSDDDARGILAMLARNGVRWRQLDHVYGDRAYAGKSGTLAVKTNEKLMDALEKASKLPVGTLLPRIYTAKRGEGRNQGSVVDGCRFIHECMVRADFTVHPRCKAVIEGLNKWAFGTEPHKDPIDALRYALIPWTYPEQPYVVPRVRMR